MKLKNPFAVLMLLLLLAVPVQGQDIHFAVGIQNVGQLSQEQTHHVRLGYTGHDIYYAVAIEGQITSATRLSAKFTTMPTFIYIWPCSQTPCEHVSRWSSRAADTAAASPVTFSTLIVGINLTPVSFAELNLGGGVALLHAGDGRLFGGIPMAVPAFGGEARVKLPLQKIFKTLPNVGVEAGADYIPARRRSRFVVIDYMSGALQGQRPVTYKQRDWLTFRLGANIAI